MAAEVATWEVNGAHPGVEEQFTGGVIRFQMVDAKAEDVTKIILRPISGVYYSYWKSIYFGCVTSPPTQINNVKFYSTGTISWTGVEIHIGDETPTLANYVQATGTLGKTGNEIVASHSGISAKTTMNTFTEGSPKSIPGSISNPDTGRISDLGILQITISTSVESGSSGSATLTWRYDES